MAGIACRLIAARKSTPEKRQIEPGFEKYRISAALNRNGDYNKQKTANRAVFLQPKTTAFILFHSLLIV
jgi:hypothetical protein